MDSGRLCFDSISVKNRVGDTVGDTELGILLCLNCLLA